MTPNNRKCAICKREIKDSWDELKEHLVSRDDVPDDVKEAFNSKEYDGMVGDESWFREVPVPYMYWRRDDVELVDNVNMTTTLDSEYMYLWCKDPKKRARIPKEKIKRTVLHLDLCDICDTVLQHIYQESIQYTDSMISETCITQDTKLTAEIVIKEVTEAD